VTHSFDAWFGDALRAILDAGNDFGGGFSNPSDDGGFEEFRDYLPQLRLQLSILSPQRGILDLKLNHTRLKLLNTLQPLLQKPHHSNKLVIGRAPITRFLHPKIIPRQRPSHAKHAGKPAGQANP